MNATRFFHVDSPVGPILVAGSDEGIVRVSFHGERRRPPPQWRRDPSAFVRTRAEFDEYFAGERTAFDLPFAVGGNPFQHAVWTAMLEIPYGQTRTYGEIAARIGEPVAASRAVGTACGENPLPLLVPCHRVVGAGGRLVGFGGGLPVKRFLLDLEFRVSPPADSLFGHTRPI